MTTASRGGKKLNPHGERVLGKLIHLKRQSTEKRLARANEAIAALDCDIRKKKAELLDLDQRSLGDLVGSLAQKQKYIEFTLSEIERLASKVKEKGLTVVPLAVFLDGNWIKVEIALARGKQLYDKRETLRRRTLDREAEQAIKERGTG